MAQSGSLMKSHGSWYVRYRELDGGKMKQKAHRLASIRDYPKQSEVMRLLHEFMGRVRKAEYKASPTLGEFADESYFPSAELRLKPSSIKGYRDAWRCHLKDRVGHLRVRDIRTVDMQNSIDEIGRKHGTSLAHGTYKNIKVALSAVMSEAKRLGLYDGVNPVQGVRVPKGKKHGRKTHAYTLAEISQHLGLFESNAIAVKQEDGSYYMPDISPAMVKALIGVAAFAGLREGEIRGLWWDDDRKDVLLVRRSIWRTVVNEDSKTGEDEAEPGMVPIIEPLRELLDVFRPEEASGWCFPNSIGGAVDLHNVAVRVIRPMLKAAGLQWQGWHAYRRGLATNLHQLGVDDLTIQAILRHSDVGTTRRSYIKTVPQDVQQAMEQLGEHVAAVGRVQ